MKKTILFIFSLCLSVHAVNLCDNITYALEVLYKHKTKYRTIEDNNPTHGFVYANRKGVVVDVKGASLTLAIHNKKDELLTRYDCVIEGDHLLKCYVTQKIGDEYYSAMACNTNVLSDDDFAYYYRQVVNYFSK